MLSKIEVLERYHALSLCFFPLHKVIHDWPVEGDAICGCKLSRDGDLKDTSACKQVGKHPMIKWGDLEGPPPFREIYDWHYNEPYANWALIMGLCDPELIAIDVDPRNGGDKSLAELIAKHGPLPASWHDNRRGGGGHFYFRHPQTLANDSACIKLAAGVEILQRKHIVVVPPSMHKSGSPYEWVHAPWDMDLADLPTWIIEAIDGMAKAKARPAYSLPPDIDISVDDRARRARAYLAKLPGGVSGHGRQNQVFHAACILTEGFALDERTAFALLAEWNEKCRPPMTESELRHKLEGAAAKVTRPGYLLKRKDTWTPPARREPTPTHTDVVAAAGGDGATAPVPPTPCGKIIAGKMCGGRRLCDECDKVAMAYWGVTDAEIDAARAAAVAFHLDQVEAEVARESADYTQRKAMNWDAGANAHYCNAPDHNPYRLDRCADCGCRSVGFTSSMPDAFGKQVDVMRFFRLRCKRSVCPMCDAIARQRAKEQVESAIFHSRKDADCTLLTWDMPDLGDDMAAFMAKVRRAGGGDYLRVRLADGRVFMLAAFYAGDRGGKPLARMLSASTWADTPTVLPPVTPTDLFDLVDPFLPPGPPADHGPRRPACLPRVADADEAAQLAFRAINQRDTACRSFEFGGRWKPPVKMTSGALGRRLGLFGRLERIARILAEGMLSPFVVEPPKDAPWLELGLRVALPEGVTPEQIGTWIGLGTAPPGGDWTLPLPDAIDDLTGIPVIEDGVLVGASSGFTVDTFDDL